MESTKNRDLENQISLNKQLFESVFYQNYKEINTLLDDGANVNARDDDGNTCLHQLANTKTCWTTGYSMTNDRAMDRRYRTDHIAVANLLIERGADVNAKNDRGQTALRVAIELDDKNIHVVDLLLRKTANISQNDEILAFKRACRNSGLSIVELLISRNIELKQSTFLHEACLGGRTEIVNLLIKHGVDVNSKDKLGRSPLHLSAFEGSKFIVEQLLKHGADINAKDNEGNTALHHAIPQKNEKMIKLLIDHGADINAKDNEGNTALHKAVFNKNQKIIDLLVDRGADIHLTNNKGISPKGQYDNTYSIASTFKWFSRKIDD